jgi:hypothetical protein
LPAFQAQAEKVRESLPIERLLREPLLKEEVPAYIPVMNQKDILLTDQKSNTPHDIPFTGDQEEKEGVSSHLSYGPEWMSPLVGMIAFALMSH